MNVKPVSVVLRRPLCTWVTKRDYDALASLAKSQDVTVAAYLRSIVVDAIAEENDRRSAGPKLAVAR